MKDPADKVLGSLSWGGRALLSTDALRRCPLFAGLDDEDFRKIKGIGLTKRMAKKRIIFSEGEPAKGFFVLLSGRVKLFKVSPEGKEQILHIVSAPDAFAEAALFLEGAYPAFAETLSDCEMVFFPKRDFVNLVTKNPQLSLNMIVSLSHYLKKFAVLIEELSLKDVSSRVAKYILDLSLKASVEGRAATEVDLDVSKTQLALKLGTISETLSRTFAKLKAKGVIDVQREKIRILDREALEQVASGLRM